VGVFVVGCLVFYFSSERILALVNKHSQSEHREKAFTIKSFVYLLAIWGFVFATDQPYWRFEAQHEVSVCPGWSNNSKRNTNPVLMSSKNKVTGAIFPLTYFKDADGEQHLLSDGQSLEVHDCVFYHFTDSAKLEKVEFRFISGREYLPVQVTADDSGAVLDLGVDDEAQVEVVLIPKIGYNLTAPTFLQYLVRWILLLCVAAVFALYSLLVIQRLSSFSARFLKRKSSPAHFGLLFIQSGMIAVWLTRNIQLDWYLSVLVWLLVTMVTTIGLSFLSGWIIPNEEDSRMHGKVTLFAFGISIVLTLLIPLQPTGMFGIVSSVTEKSILFNYRLLGKVVLFDFSLWAMFSFLITSRKVYPPNPSLARRWMLIYALPLMAVGFVMLLTFWPGIMSQDSFYQWMQILDFEFDAWHPIFHTLLNWLITRVWMSPAAVASAQILSLSLAVGYALYRFEKAGVPKLAVGAAAIISAFVPANAFYMVTLWKDVLYTIIYIWLTVFMLEIYYSRGQWITEVKNLILLGTMLACAGLTRHNGFIEMTILVIFLVVLYKRNWRRWMITGILATSLFAIANYAFEQYLPKPTATPGTSTQGAFAGIIEHHIRAHIYSGTEMEQTERSLLSQTMPTLALLDSYSCHTSLQTDFYYAAGLYDKNNMDELIRAYLAIISRSPWIEVRHQTCNLSGIWRVFPRADETKYLSPIRVHPSSDELIYHMTPDLAKLAGITQDSKIPILARTFGEYIAKMTKDNSLFVAPWRVAPYLYIVLIGMFFRVLVYEKEWRVLVLGGPIIAHLVLFAFVSVFDDFRFHYMILPIACITWPLLFLRGSIPRPARN
jgi:hypothetical protein